MCIFILYIVIKSVTISDWTLALLSKYISCFFFYRKRLHKKNQSHDPSSPMILSDLEQQ